MGEHNLFYYPYASFAKSQLPILKVAALYFDSLVILDPVDASWDTIGADHIARDAVRKLADAQILKKVKPSWILDRYEDQITKAVRIDMKNGKFLDLCDAHSRASAKGRWTLALAKVPKALEDDELKAEEGRKSNQRMRSLMGDFAREVAGDTARAARGPNEADYFENIQALSALTGQPNAGANEREVMYRGYSEAGQAYDEFREGYDRDVEYRYADMPLALGESIMMNHALFAGLDLAAGTPITDDPFHNQALSLKLAEAGRSLQTQAIIADRRRALALKENQLAFAALTDRELNLPILNPDLPIDAVLELRWKHDADLQGLRQKLARMARRIEAEPWSPEFEKELEHKTIPDIADELDKAREMAKSWVKGTRAKLRWEAGGIALATASATLSILAAPFTPLGLAAGGVSLLAAGAVPGAQWFTEWREGKGSAQENAFHYLLRLPGGKKMSYRGG